MPTPSSSVPAGIPGRPSCAICAPVSRRKSTAPLSEGMCSMGGLWQAAGTVQSVLRPGLLEKAARSGLRSLFVCFETLNPTNLHEHHKYQNLNRDYGQAIRRLHGLGVMANGSFV